MRLVAVTGSYLFEDVLLADELLTLAVRSENLHIERIATVVLLAGEKVHDVGQQRDHLPRRANERERFLLSSLRTARTVRISLHRQSCNDYAR